MFSAIKTRPRLLGVLAGCLVVALSGHAAPSVPQSSLLLLIDTSGSMANEVGGGNSEIKIEAAKSAALAAVEQASRRRNIEVAVLAFEGDCSQPVSRRTGFTTDFSALAGFISGLQPGGGTPMAEAVVFANQFMKDQGAPSARDQMIVLLADGENDCGSVTDAIRQLRTSGVIFRHETVGFGIEPTSNAAQDLQNIATASGGTYHHAQNATQLGAVFMEFVNTVSVIDLLGTFGRRRPSSTASGEEWVRGTAQTPPISSQSARDNPSDLLGRFRPRASASSQREGLPASESMWGALAIDRNQGPSWGWAIDYGTLQAATQRALAECSVENCHIVMAFTNQCAAFAADQAQGSSVYGWSKGNDAASTRNAALNHCRARGGTSCLVRVWGCTTRP